MILILVYFTIMRFIKNSWFFHNFPSGFFIFFNFFSQVRGPSFMGTLLLHVTYQTWWKFFLALLILCIFSVLQLRTTHLHADVLWLHKYLLKFDFSLSLRLFGCICETSGLRYFFVEGLFSKFPSR